MEQKHRNTYSTEEERIEARRASGRRYMNRVNKGIDDDSYVYPGRKHAINNKDGIRIIIDTVDRANIKIITINYFITFKWNHDYDSFEELRDEIKRGISSWLSGQEDWDSKNKIFIWEVPKDNTSYVGKYSCISFQLYIRRNTPVQTWKETLKGILPFTDELTDIIKNTCHEVGIEIAYRGRLNSPDYGSSAITTEED